jgi:nitrile hydratase beta subunit-like protein
MMSPNKLMSQPENLVNRLPNDLGGLAAGPVQITDHELLPWEKRCHALADVLDFHKIINTEEKRRGVEALGSEMVGKLSYYERWAVAFSNILFAKGILVPSQLADKMDEVQQRWRDEAAKAERAGL